MLPAQIVVAFEKLRLRIERSPALGETACLAMQWHNVLADCPVQALQKRGRDLPWAESTPLLRRLPVCSPIPDAAPRGV